MEIEQNEREIAIAQEEIGTLDRLHRLPAADPEKAATFLRSIRHWIKGIPPINERQREIALLPQKLRDHERSPRAKPRCYEFIERSARKGKRSRVKVKFLWLDNTAVRPRKLLLELLPQVRDLRDLQNMFIRTLLRISSSREAEAWHPKPLESTRLRVSFPVNS